MGMALMLVLNVASNKWVLLRLIDELFACGVVVAVSGGWFVGVTLGFLKHLGRFKPSSVRHDQELWRDFLNVQRAWW